MLQNAAIVFPLVGNLAAGAILEAIFCIVECTTTAITQGIERALAVQAAEILRICTGMTGEILTFPVLMIRIMLAIPFFHDHTSVLIKLSS